MNEGIALALSLVLGLALGGAYFAGLWWTAGSPDRTERPALLVLMLAGALTWSNFGTTAGPWSSGPTTGASAWRPLACLAGFLLLRAVFTAKMTPKGALGGEA